MGQGRAQPPAVGLHTQLHNCPHFRQTPTTRRNSPFDLPRAWSRSYGAPVLSRAALGVVSPRAGKVRSCSPLRHVRFPEAQHFGPRCALQTCPPPSEQAGSREPPTWSGRASLSFLPSSRMELGRTYRYEVKTLRLEGSSESPRSEQSTLSSILPSGSH